MYLEHIKQMKKTLGQLVTWLNAADEYAKSKSFDSSVLMASRLAPDQFPCGKQIQIACDAAKLGVSRITGKEAPSHPDTETTTAEFRARIASVIAYLDGFTANDFEGSPTRVVNNPRWEGKTMTGHDYFMEHMVPNFYFHTVHTYAILRHNGVSLGKKDYLGTLTLK